MNTGLPLASTLRTTREPGGIPAAGALVVALGAPITRGRDVSIGGAAGCPTAGPVNGGAAGGLAVPDLGGGSSGYEWRWSRLWYGVSVVGCVCWRCGCACGLFAGVCGGLLGSPPIRVVGTRAECYNRSTNR